MVLRGGVDFNTPYQVALVLVQSGFLPDIFWILAGSVDQYYNLLILELTHCSYAAILTRLREGNETFSPLTMSVRLRCRRVTP